MSRAELQAWFAAKRQQRGWRPSIADLEILQHVFEAAEPAAAPANGTAASLATSLPAHVRPGAAFAKLSLPTVIPDDFAVETYDALLRYAEAVASGHLPSKLKPVTPDQ